MTLIKYLLLDYFKSGADILVLLLWLNVMTFVLVESAKSSAYVLGVLCAVTRLVCFCAYVHVCLACCRAEVLVCLASCVLTCPRLGVLACLRAHVFGMFACFMSLRGHMSYMLWHRLSYFLYIWKVNSQKSLYKKNFFWFIEVSRNHFNIYEGDFAKKITLRAFDYFCKKALL